MRNLILNSIAASGLPRLAHRVFWRDHLTILMYHAVVRERPPFPDECFLDEASFRAQMEYLAGRFEVLPLAEAARRLRTGGIDRDRTGRPIAAITFDDGYQNNFDVAFPILRELNLPATIFLTTGFVGTDDTVWYGRLNEALGRTRRSWIEWRGQSFSLGTPEERTLASARLQAGLKRLPSHELQQALRAIIAGCGDEKDYDDEHEHEHDHKVILSGSLYRMLDGAAVRAMAESGLIEFGAHTHSHAILTGLPAAEARSEIETSIREVEALTGRPCRLFAYPNGQRADYDAAAIEALARLGIEAGVTTIEGPNSRRTAPLELRRYAVGPGLTPAGFRLTVHHALTFLRRLAGRLA